MTLSLASRGSWKELERKGSRLRRRWLRKERVRKGDARAVNRNTLTALAWRESLAGRWRILAGPPPLELARRRKSTGFCNSGSTGESDESWPASGGAVAFAAGPSNTIDRQSGETSLSVARGSMAWTKAISDDDVN